MSSNLLNIIKSNKSDIFRKCFIKRRDAITGLYESDWYEITKDIISFGKVKSQIDSVRLYKFSFGTVKIVVDNTDGKYNPENIESSLWYGYLNQQRTLVKLEIGFKSFSINSNGIYYESTFPEKSMYDISYYDTDGAVYDSLETTVFIGVISNDIVLSDKNEVSFNIAPLTQVLQEFPARNLTGWTSTGFTASQFIEKIRDQVDTFGNYIFRPFFGNTTTNWEISATTNMYSNLNTSTAKDVVDKTTWEVIEKLSEAENFIPYISREGKFIFKSRDPNTTTVAYEFHGAGSFNTTYGQTIKQVTSYSKSISKYYSRIQLKWIDSDTSTSFAIAESILEVSPSSNPWVLGTKTLELENYYVPNTATANSIVQNIFNDYSALKTEIEFTTSLIPHLDLLDKVSIYYDPSQINVRNLWDQNNWADSISSSSDLIFDYSKGDAIILNGEEFKFLSYEIDLDNLENKFKARGV